MFNFEETTQIEDVNRSKTEKAQIEFVSYRKLNPSYGFREVQNVYDVSKSSFGCKQSHFQNHLEH